MNGFSTGLQSAGPIFLNKKICPYSIRPRGKLAIKKENKNHLWPAKKHGRAQRQSKESVRRHKNFYKLHEQDRDSGTISLPLRPGPLQSDQCEQVP